MKAFMIGGDRSGSGKTSIAVGIASILSSKYEIQTFKVGMDYIDPSYLSAASGRPCRNLDGFVMDQSQIRLVVDHAARGADILLVEGVRGLFEGADALKDTGSSAEIAKLLDIPVVLVVNARSITRSAAALIKGFLSFDQNLRICGIILNNIFGDTHRQKAITAIEHTCGIPVFGAIPQEKAMELEMRHLGLIPYREGRTRTQFRETVTAIGSTVARYVDVERILDSAREYTPLPVQSDIFNAERECDVKIGIALDEAFNFYYADLFDVLRGCGAEYSLFSPIHDRLPEVDGYIIGGGYPELFGRELEKNDSIRASLREVALSGKPIYAECGGLIYLTERVILSSGWRGNERESSYEMCGIFPGITRMPAQRIVSYVEGTSCERSPLGRGTFRGHEFHYSDVQLAADTDFCYHLTRGSGINGAKDGALKYSVLASYTHLAPVPSYSMVAQFVETCRNYAS